MRIDITHYASVKPATLRRIAKEKHNVRGTLLSTPKGNPKVAKNQKLGVLTFPLHLAPFSLSGHNVCSHATAGCAAACLHTAGNPAHMRGKHRARLARTRLFFADRALYFALLINEIARAETIAHAANMVCGVRLNATSDLRYEKFVIVIDCDARTLFDRFPDVSFYDYTKIPGRVTPANYDLTFSLAENNTAAALRELHRGRNVAAVFNVTRGRPLPSHWRAFEVIDADLHDYRPADPRGTVAGLRAKGLARGDASGFVQAA